MEKYEYLSEIRDYYLTTKWTNNYSDCYLKRYNRRSFGWELMNINPMERIKDSSDRWLCLFLYRRKQMDFVGIDGEVIYFLMEPINTLELSIRAYKRIYEFFEKKKYNDKLNSSMSDIFLVFDLVRANPAVLEGIEGFGSKCFDEIYDCLKPYKLKLGQEFSKEVIKQIEDNRK